MNLDETVDRWFDRFRGQPVYDRAAVVLSNLSDYGIVWVLEAGMKARRPGPARWRAVRSLAIAGFGSLGVNAAIKSAVRRRRPSGVPAAKGVRTPTSSSFPSGHTLASFATAVVLADSPAALGGYLAFATAVAASRVHLRAHHPTDALGGAAIGVALGVAGRRLREWPPPHGG